MKLLKNIRALMLAMLCMLMLSACGAPARTSDSNEGNVQDIQPGEQSIIQPPAPSSGQRSTLEERTL